MSSSNSESSAHAPLHHQVNSGLDRSHKDSVSNKRKRSINNADDEKSSASSSIGWNPEWEDDNDDVQNEPTVAPVSSINVETTDNIVKEELFHEHIPSVRQEHPGQHDETSSDGSDDILQSPLAIDAAVRYEMLGAPTLVYRHTPSYRDTSSWPTPLTPGQVDVALYMKEHPLGSWFSGGATNRGLSDTYPRSIQRYLPEKSDKVNEDKLNDPVDALLDYNRSKVQQSYDLPMQRLETERLKWLEWKLYRWENKVKERKKRHAMLSDYYMERDIQRLVYVWEREDEDSVARRYRRREKRRKKQEAENEDKANSTIFDWEPRARTKSEVDEKLAGLELPLENPLIDQSSVNSSSSSISDSTNDSIWSSSVSSMNTYYTDESDFYRWEEQVLEELNDVPSKPPNSVQLKKRELLSSWVFDGDPSNDTITKRNSVDSSKEQYSFNELVEMLERLQGNKQHLILPGIDPVPRRCVEEECTKQHPIGGASSYGNCLVIVKCTCISCGKERAERTISIQNMPSYFLIRPTGATLSCVTMNRVLLPRSAASNCRSGMSTLDVDERILQICICGQSAIADNQKICLVVRTVTYCCVLIAKPKAVKSNPSGSYDCPESFDLTERARIDLRTPRIANQPSFVPYHVACDPKRSISFFTIPSFAILGCDEDGNTNNIHCVTLDEQCCIKHHDFSAVLADVSIIEFDPRDRHILWAAARSSEMLAVPERFFKRGASKGSIIQGISGLGHSLYRIDLRNASASFVWSPSHDDFLAEGVYSISGIMPDTKREQILWISSTSAGKTWALDVRYKSPKVVVSWSLPSLCDDLGAHCSITGIHGAGVLMNQPMSSAATKRNYQPTMFSIKKDTNTATLNAYQFPTAMPRFQTRPLESSGFVEVTKAQYDTTSISRSTTFALPDVSNGIFNIGLSLLELPSFTSLSGKKLNQLGYNASPSRSVYAFTMTSVGDVYCHILLACDATEQSEAKLCAGLSAGSTSIPVPETRGSNKQHAHEKLVVELSNEFPIPARAMSSMNRRGKESVNVQSINIKEIARCRRGKLKHGEDDSQTNTQNEALQQLPCSLHHMDSEQQVQYGCNILILSDDNFNNGIAQMNDPHEHSEVIHSATRDSVVAIKDGSSLHSQREYTARNTIKVERKHLLIAYQDAHDESMSWQPDLRAGDLNSAVLEKLKSSYCGNNVEEEESNQFVVGEDRYSDDDSVDEAGWNAAQC